MLLKRSILFSLWLLPVFVLSTPTAKGCSCTNRPTVQEQYDWANIVVIAQAVSVEKVGETARSTEGIRSTTMVVEKVFKGSLKVGEQMTFAQGAGADCVWGFSEKSIGQRYLFYLSQDSKNRVIWIASICGRSNRLDFAADDLLFLENIGSARGKTRLSGTFSFYDPPIVQGQERTHKTLARRKVRIIGEKETYELVTNPDGVYEIYDLPPGRYKIEPEIPRGFHIDYSLASKVPNTNRLSDSGRSKR